MTPPTPPPPCAPATAPASVTGEPVAKATATIGNGLSSAAKVHPAGDHNDQLMAAIRGGINLKPAKTNDRSTPAFIKQSNVSLLFAAPSFCASRTCDDISPGKPFQIGLKQSMDSGRSALGLGFDKEQGVGAMLRHLIDYNRVEGVLDNDDPGSCGTYDKSCSIGEMKDALQAELRSTLKRKMKKHDLEEGDSRTNEEIERAIEHTRSEVQLKVNSASATPSTEAPKVDNPLKKIIDIVDKGRGEEATVASATKKHPSPVPTQKKVTSVPSTPTPSPFANGTATLRKVSATQYPIQNGGTTVLHVTPATTGPVVNGQKTNSSPAAPKKLISNGTIGSSASVTPQVSPVAATGATKANGAVSNGPVKVANGSIPKGATANSNGPVKIANDSLPKGVATSSNGPVKVANGSIPLGNAASSNSAVKIANGTLPKGTTASSNGPVKVANDNLPKGAAVSSDGPVKIANGTLPKGATASSNGTAFKTNSFQSKLPPSSAVSASVATPNTYSNTLPRANGVTKAVPKTSTSAAPEIPAGAVKISFGLFGDTVRSTPPPNTTASRSKFEPLTIDTSSTGGAGSSTNSSSPSTPKELLSPQVRSGTAAIRPSQIRNLTKAGSVVSHTDILETPKPIAKLPVALIEPAPVLTAAAAVLPPPKKTIPPATVAPLPPVVSSAKEYTPLYEKATTRDAPRSPLNRWSDSSSASGGTARKLLITHGRPNFKINRSNSRQGFDVDVSDTKVDAVKPVFRILTDLEKMEQQQQEEEQQQQQQQQTNQQAATRTQPSQQQYVSFAKDLSNAPNNHPDVAVVKKTVPASAPADPFLSTLKDIKIDIGEMKVVNAKGTASDGTK
uniref:WH2 domain-containing protein n=1 Tax=Anopheles farauti TaxID=69004 RepID=A0A182Q534_9DIPT